MQSPSFRKYESLVTRGCIPWVTSLGSGSPPYACPRAGHVKTQIQVCTKVFSRHTFVHVLPAETPRPSSSDPRSYLNMLLFRVYTEIDGCGVWRLLSLPMPPVWRELTKHTVLSSMQGPLGFPLYRSIPTDSVSWAPVEKAISEQLFWSGAQHGHVSLE